MQPRLIALLNALSCSFSRFHSERIPPCCVWRLVGVSVHITERLAGPPSECVWNGSSFVMKRIFCSVRIGGLMGYVFGSPPDQSRGSRGCVSSDVPVGPSVRRLRTVLQCCSERSHGQFPHFRLCIPCFWTDKRHSF